MLVQVYGETTPRRGSSEKTSAIDELVTQLVPAHLAESPLEVEEGLGQSEALARIERQIAEVMAAYRSGELSAASAFPNVSELERRKSEMPERLGAASPWSSTRNGCGCGMGRPDHRAASGHCRNRVGGCCAPAARQARGGCL